MSIRPSRLSLETRTNTSLDVIRTYIEVDFVGPGESTELRIRHFWAQWKNVLVGQAWSTFSDSDVIPETADFNGPNAWIFQFNPQVRYTYALSKQDNLIVSAEQPDGGIPGATPVTAQPITSTNPMPDFVVRYRLTIHELKEEIILPLQPEQAGSHHAVSEHMRPLSRRVVDSSN